GRILALCRRVARRRSLLRDRSGDLPPDASEGQRGETPADPLGPAPARRQSGSVTRGVWVTAIAAVVVGGRVVALHRRFPQGPPPRGARRSGQCAECRARRGSAAGRTPRREFVLSPR